MPARSNIWLVALVGVSSLLIGFAVSTLAYRYRYLRVPGGSIIERMNHELHLTPAQHDRVGDIMRDTRFKVMQARRDYEHRRHDLFWQGLSEVRGVLTPEQQQIFDRDFSHLPMEVGEHEHMHDGSAEPPPAPQPSP